MPGVYGHGAALEDVRARLYDMVMAEEAAREAETLRFPPLLPRRQLERSGYLASFPHLAGTVCSFDGSEAEAAQQAERAERHEDWSEFQSMTDLVLAPAACFQLYPVIAARGELPPSGVLVDPGAGVGVPARAIA